MLKVGIKRRRTTSSVKAEANEARVKEQSIKDKLARFDKMKKALDEEN